MRERRTFFINITREEWDNHIKAIRELEAEIAQGLANYIKPQAHKVKLISEIEFNALHTGLYKHGNTMNPFNDEDTVYNTTLIPVKGNDYMKKLYEQGLEKKSINNKRKRKDDTK